MPRKLKILHTMTWLSPGGGVDQNVLLTVTHTAADYDVHLAVGPEIHHNPFTNVPGLVFLVCPHLVRPIHPVKDLKAVWWFYRLIKTQRYDIVHTHESKASLVTRVASWLAGCPFTIYGLHGVTFNDPMSRARRGFLILLEKLTIRTADLIVAVSRDAVGEYHKRHIGTGLPFAVVYSGIDVTHFERQAAHARQHRAELRRALGIEPDDLLLVNVGRFSSAKGQRFTLEAFARLAARHPGLKLLFVGEGELKDACLEQAARLGVADKTIFAGFKENVAEMVSLSDLLLLSSLREGLPRAAVEAYLCGVPVVAFEVEGIREVIEDGVTGFIVPQYDVDALAEKAGALLGDQPLRSRFSELGRQRVRDQWDHRRMITALRRIYDGSQHGT